MLLARTVCSVYCLIRTLFYDFNILSVQLNFTNVLLNFPPPSTAAHIHPSLRPPFPTTPFIPPHPFQQVDMANLHFQGPKPHLPIGRSGKIVILAYIHDILHCCMLIHCMLLSEIVLILLYSFCRRSPQWPPCTDATWPPSHGDVQTCPQTVSRQWGIVYYISVAD